jgi:hypothetical protein
VALEIALYFLGIRASLGVIRWFTAHVELRSGRRFEFRGEYAELLGWHIVLVLSIFTIVGWAWVLAAFFRWMARKTRGGDAVLAFHGEAVEMLSRTLVAILWCLPVVTMPWAWLWWTRWVVRSTTVEVRNAQVAGRSFSANFCRNFATLGATT